MPDDKSKLVYSTDRLVSRKEKPDEEDAHTGVQPSQQKVLVRLDRWGRGGKCVTVVDGLLMPRKEKEAFLKQMKTRFGTGGTVTDMGLEIRGDHRDAIVESLTKIGYSPKRSGG